MTMTSVTSPIHIGTVPSPSEAMAAMLEAVADSSAYARRYVDQCKVGQADLGTAVKQDAHVLADAVTVLDPEIERQIFAKLKLQFPTYMAVGEESNPDRPGDAKNGDMCWVLDPLDGTKNVKNGSDEFAISLALQRFEDGRWETIAGVIASPMKDKVVWAEKGKGAYIRERFYDDDDVSRFRVRQVKVTPKTYKTAAPDDSEILGGRNVAVCLGRVAEPMLMSVLAGIKGDVSHHQSRFESIRMINSVAADLSMIGNGRDAMVMGGLEEHDKAAGLLFATETGALMNTFTIKTPDSDRSSKPVHKEIHIVASDQAFWINSQPLPVKRSETRGLDISFNDGQNDGVRWGGYADTVRG